MGIPRQRFFMDDRGKANNALLYDVLIISPDGGQIRGKMKNNFSYSLAAKYADLFNGLIPGSELLMKTGDASLASGLFTQKYFQGGNNLQLTVEFRVYDNGSLDKNPVALAARVLSGMTVSRPFTASQTAKRLGAKTQAALNLGKAAFEKASEGDLRGAATLLGSAASFLEQRERLVELRISSYFRCTKMLIESVNVTYSKEQTHTGPLYGDFSVSFISQQAIVKGNDTSYGVNFIFADELYNVYVNGERTRLTALQSNATGNRR